MSAIARELTPADVVEPDSLCADCGIFRAEPASFYCKACGDALGTLWHRDEIRHIKFAFTYRALSRHADVQRELLELYEALAPRLESSFPRLGFAEIETADDRARAEALSSRWRLPRARGAQDVLSTCESTWSMRRRVDPDRFPRLFGPIQLRPALLGVSRSGERAMGTMSEPAAIVPPIPIPFGFDPASVSDRQLAERAREVGAVVASSILEQGRHIREERASSGDWRALPLRYRSPGELQRHAARLARRMCGMRWSEIRDAEIADTPRADERRVASRRKARADTVTDDAVQLSVEEWARDLGIDLSDVGERQRGTPHS